VSNRQISVPVGLCDPRPSMTSTLSPDQHPMQLVFSHQKYARSQESFAFLQIHAGNFRKLSCVTGHFRQCRSEQFGEIAFRPP
jgi:hypothetical protein